MRKLLLALAFAAGSTAVGSAGAEVYPSRPIKLIVPFSAGGVTDITARIVDERMRASLGQPVIAENVAPGGPCGTRRLHDRHRPVDVPRRVRRDLPASIRPAEGSRAGDDALDRTALDHRKEDPSGKRHEGAARMELRPIRTKREHQAALNCSTSWKRAA